ncbi:hypothetical protein [Streptomyces sp. NRRL F-5126]|uniref:hypothetical protein n=1 Tax=Streptomyces sp. NRRL F-5126 TaxID=1463857 RepID=UPI0004C664E3|nr:hypothetical protein [Streptomyces sp. NRRL F-5126]
MTIDRLAARELSETWSLPEGTSVRTDTYGGRAVVLVDSPRGGLRVDDPSSALAEALRRMSLGPVRLPNLVPDFPAYDSPPAHRSAAAVDLLRRLSDVRYVVDRHLMLGAGLMVTVSPAGRSARFLPVPLPRGRGDALVTLTRGARFSRSGTGLVLESDLSDHRVELHGPEARWLMARVPGMRLRDLERVVRLPRLPLPPGATDAFVAYLVAARMLSLSP